MTEMTIETFVQFIHHFIRSPRFIIQLPRGDESTYTFEIRELNLLSVSKTELLRKTIDLLHEKTSEDSRETLTNELVILSQTTLMKSDRIATLEVEPTGDGILHVMFFEDKKTWFSGVLDTEEAIDWFTVCFQSVVNDNRMTP